MRAVRLSQVSACLRTLEQQAPALYQALAQGLAGHSTAEAAGHKRGLSTAKFWAAPPELPHGISPLLPSQRTLQRSFAADASPSSSDADQINPLLQAPSPGTAGSLGKPSDTAQAILRGAAISPKKLNRFASVIRGLHIEDALIQCQASPLKAANLTHTVRLSTDCLCACISVASCGSLTGMIAC